MHIDILKASFEGEDTPEDFTKTRIVRAASDIQTGFTWNYTKEGQDFWQYVHERLNELADISPNTNNEDENEADTEAAGQLTRKELRARMAPPEAQKPVGKINAARLTDAAHLLNENLAWLETREGWDFWAFVYNRLREIASLKE